MTAFHKITYSLRNQRYCRTFPTDSHEWSFAMNDTQNAVPKMSQEFEPMPRQAVTAMKSVGIDTEVMADAAKEKASELQQMIAAEVRRHPYRALAIAAAVGFVFGVTR